MKCAFDLAHYGELLAARPVGRLSVRFLRPRAVAPGDLLLRHDVDLSLDAALTLAELEAEAGAQATYFLMTQSVFYNLASPEGEHALGRLRELGHGVGLHAVYPRLDLDDRFDPVVAWHNPDPEFMREPLDGAVNVMQPGCFDPDHYRSDSNQHWRSGCPHEELAAGSVRVAAAAHASRDLGLPGRDDAGDDAGDARGRARPRSRAPGRRPDRPVT